MHFLHWWSENILDLSVQVLAFLIQFNSTHSFFTYIFLFNSNKHVFFLVCSLRVQSLCSAFQNYCRFAIGCPGLIVSKIYLVHVLSSLWKQAFKYGNYHIHKWAMKNCKLENQEIRESYKYIDLPIPKQWQLLNLKSLTVWPRSNFSSNYLHLNKLHTMRMKQVIIERRQCWFVNKLLSWRPSCKKTRVKYAKFDVCSYAQGDTPDFKWWEWSKDFVGVWNFRFHNFFGWENFVNIIFGGLT